ncbi:MAG: membrane dipeptidase [Deltaproteobacteria bacterium]
MSSRIRVFVVEGFESLAEFPILTKGLLSRGYSPEEVKKVIGGNWLRLFEEVWSTEA